MIKFQNSLNVHKSIAKKVYYTMLLVSIIWIFLILLAPLLIDSKGASNKISSFIYIFFSKVCHQDDLRSYYIFGNKLGVCSRCLFIYIGFFLGTLIYPLKNKLSNTNLPSVLFLIAASVLLSLDVILDMTGIFPNTFFSRSLTGFIIGFILPFYIIPGFLKFFYEVHTFVRNKFSI